MLIVRGLLNSNMEKEYQDLYDSCIHNLKSQLWISLKVPISLREKLLYIAWAIIMDLCQDVVRIKLELKQRIINNGKIFWNGQLPW